MTSYLSLALSHFSSMWFHLRIEAQEVNHVFITSKHQMENSFWEAF